MLRNLVCSLPLLFIGGCGGHDHDHAHDGGHHHEAMNEGGVIAELGDHLAQLEAALDAEAGTITLWVWDHGNAVRLTDESVSAEVTVGDETFTLACAAQESTLTGETVGDSSEFMGQDDRLKGAEHVDVRVPTITVKGIECTDAEFHLPPH